MIATLRRFFRRVSRSKTIGRTEVLQHLALCAGTLPCPHCKDTGPHEDNDGIGGELYFRCRYCRSRIRVKDYDWEWAANQPRFDFSELKDTSK